MTANELTELLGWASIINSGYLLVSTVTIVFCKDWITRVHSQLFNIEKSKLMPIYFNFLSTYKVVTIVFCIVPYLSLKIIG